MSWPVFQAEMMALTGNPHTTTNKFAQTLAKAYHKQIASHIDTISGGGKVIIPGGKDITLYQDIYRILTQNSTSHNEINFIEQIGPAILKYWVGGGCIGPAGASTITSTGTWTPTPLPKNLDFRIIVLALITTCQLHILTLQGLHTIITPPGVVPWTGSFLVCL